MPGDLQQPIDLGARSRRVEQRRAAFGRDGRLKSRREDPSGWPTAATWR